MEEFLKLALFSCPPCTQLCIYGKTCGKGVRWVIRMMSNEISKENKKIMIKHQYVKDWRLAFVGSFWRGWQLIVCCWQDLAGVKGLNCPRRIASRKVYCVISVSISVLTCSNKYCMFLGVGDTRTVIERMNDVLTGSYCPL